MRLTADDISILYAALAAMLHGDEEPWEDLTQDEMERASLLHMRFESKAHMDDFDEDNDDTESAEDDDDEDYN